MKRSALIISSLVGVAGLSVPVLGQNATIQDAAPESQRALQDFQQSSQNFNQNGSLNLNELIHRANLANSRSLEQFTEEQNASFNEAVEAFRKQQQSKIKPLQPTP